MSVGVVLSQIRTPASAPRQGCNLIRSSLFLPVLSPYTHISDQILFSEMRLPNVTDALGNLTLSNPHRILVVGCAYGGISTVINLLEYSQGKARQPVYPGPDFKGAISRRGVEITVIDERDGYCASPHFSRGLAVSLLHDPLRHNACSVYANQSNL
jgi:hypothetical protein